MSCFLVGITGSCMIRWTAVCLHYDESICPFPPRDIPLFSQQIAVLLVGFNPNSSLHSQSEMFSNILQRKNFSIRRNATKRWKQAVAGQQQDNDSTKGLRQQKSLQEPLSVVIHSTSMNTDQQKQAVEIANIALDTQNLESEIASQIKKQMDEFTGQTWHVVVGRNFGSHVTWANYVHFVAGKIHILIFQWG